MRQKLPFTKKDNEKLDKFVESFLDDRNLSYEWLGKIVSGGIDVADRRKYGLFTEAASVLPERGYKGVREHLIRRYHPNNNLPWSKEEEEMLKLLVTKHDKQWTLIGHIMDRPGANVKDKFRALQCTVTGPWTKEDSQKLDEIVRQVAKEKNIDIPSSIDVKTDAWNVASVNAACQGLPWRQISLRMQTRNQFQCRKHWLDRMVPTISRLPTAESHARDLFIIHRLKEMDCDDETEVNWNHVDPNRLGNRVQDRFDDLKKRLPTHKSLEWHDLLDKLEEKLINEYKPPHVYKPPQEQGWKYLNEPAKIHLAEETQVPSTLASAPEKKSKRDRKKSKAQKEVD